MAMTSPNIKFMLCVEVKIPGGITLLYTNYACRKMFTYEVLLHTPLRVPSNMSLNCQTCTYFRINAYSKCHGVIVFKGVQD